MLLAFILVLCLRWGAMTCVSAGEQEHVYVVFEDNFEDGNADGWEITIPPNAPSGSRWAVELDDGNHVLSEAGEVWAEAGDYLWTNYTFEVKVKFIVDAGAHINFRMSGPGNRYFFRFFYEEFTLEKEYLGMFTRLCEGEGMPLAQNRWYAIKIVCVGNSIKVYVDGVLRLDYVDEEDPILSGRIGFERGPEFPIFFDDVRVSTTHRLYVTHLIRAAQSEIDEARTLGADTGEAEVRLAEAGAALEGEDLSKAEELAKEAASLAEHAHVGLVSVSELWKYSAEYDQRTVEVSGTIREIRYDQGIYNFAVDDGTGVISAMFEGSLGDIKVEDTVRVTGIFDASSKTIAAESLEKVKPPTEGLYTFLLFKDDFEDGDYSDWRVDVDPEVEGSAWAVVVEDDNHVLRGEGHTTCMAGDAEWTDYILAFKIKLVKGMVFVNFRLTQKPEAPDRYTLRLSRSDMVLLKGEKSTGERQFTELKRVGADLSPDEWHTVKILCLGGNIKIYVDDGLKIDYTDEESPFLSGSISFEPVTYEGGKPSIILFDDVKVSRMATTADIHDLVVYARSEIDKAREVNADVSAAELKLEQAEQALAQEDYKMAQYLIDESVWLAKRSSVGQISVKDLLALATRVSGHTVTLKGAVESLEALYGVGYEFELDDGTGRIHVFYQGAIADIGEDYEVKVTGVFDAPTRAVTASAIEKISAPATQPEAAAGPAGLTWSIELVATLISIGGAGAGAIGWIVRARSRSRRKKVLFKRLMDEVDNVYSRFKMNARRCEAELQRLKGEALDEFKEGMIDEETYNILNKRIDDYMREIREEIEKENA